MYGLGDFSTPASLRKDVPVRLPNVYGLGDPSTALRMTFIRYGVPISAMLITVTSE